MDATLFMSHNILQMDPIMRLDSNQKIL